MIAVRRVLADSPLLRVSVNSLWLLAARLGGQVLGLLSTILIARRLGETGLGQYAFIAAVVFIGNTLSTFGLDTLIIRDVSTRTRDWQQTLSAALLIQLALSAAFVLGVFVVGPRLSNQTVETLPAFRVASLALLPLAFSTISSALLRANERMDLYALFSLVTAGLAAGGTALALVRGHSLTGVAVAMFAAQTAGALLAGALVRGYLPAFRWRWTLPRGSSTRRALQIGLTLAMLMLLSVFYQRIATLMLSLMEGDAATGWYSAAARIIEALKTLPAAFFGALFPVAARAAAGAGRRAYGRIYRRAFIGLIALTLTGATITFMLAGLIIRLLYGPGYEPAVVILRVLVWSLPATLFALKFSFDLVTTGRERVAVIALALALLMTAVMLWLLIGLFGPVGAAVAVVLGESLHVCLLWVLSHVWKRVPLVTEKIVP